jgi:septal ring factor EnvC (AmiA/AmiB activator)
MPQKKSAKRVKMKKTTTKTRTSHQGVLSLAEKVEKEFRQIPTKLAKLYRQEVMSLKQQENKLKAELKQVAVLHSTAQKKHAKLAAEKMTTTTKKQLVNAKKTMAQATKTMKDLANNLAKTSKSIAALVAKQTKYTALNAELAKLEKKLAAEMKKSVKAPKNSVKKAKVTKAKKSKATPAVEPLAEQSSITSTETLETVEME